MQRRDRGSNQQQLRGGGTSNAASEQCSAAIEGERGMAALERRGSEQEQLRVIEGSENDQCSSSSAALQSEE